MRATPPASTAPRAPHARAVAPPRRGPAPPHGRHRVRDDTNWRDVLEAQKPKYAAGKEEEEDDEVEWGVVSGSDDNETVEALFTIDGGWKVDVVEEEDDDDDDGRTHWIAGPAFPGPDVVPTAAAAAPTAPLTSTSLDLDALPPDSALGSIPRHVLARLLAAQDAAASEPPVKPRGKPRDRTTHTLLTIQGGAARGVKLRSGRGDTTRPMMAKVKAALFDMLTCGSPAGPGAFPPGATWLDLFAGTGSVGLEAVSRGAASADFVEMDPWVVASVLKPNAAAVAAAAEVEPSVTRFHTTTAQAFMERYQGSGYDYVSVCPPYVKVEYGELLSQVASSNVLHEHSVVIVEYPIRAVGRMPAELAGLVRVRDRRYGRTNVAVYGQSE